ncbi:hypothetical protein B0T16DRAFT_169928 [Cercophora newfieldiana]|uniref:Uncharacterized protein n=1 Tax=Cercophora newfieldiana TaxID=92897 RepID=A0AA40CQD9_9PEZI|nr:hypothetical protein B0T16DRAFT_169928 [Cercophora newfieldiana]
MSARTLHRNSSQHYKTQAPQGDRHYGVSRTVSHERYKHAKQERPLGAHRALHPQIENRGRSGKSKAQSSRPCMQLSRSCERRRHVRFLPRPVCLPARNRSVKFPVQSCLLQVGWALATRPPTAIDEAAKAVRAACATHPQTPAPLHLLQTESDDDTSHRSPPHDETSYSIFHAKVRSGAKMHFGEPLSRRHLSRGGAGQRRPMR